MTSVRSNQAADRYPTPDRANFTANQHRRDPLMPEGDLGSATAALSDGRPYTIESWYTGGATFITLFFSVLDLEAADPPRLLTLISPVLDEAAIPTKFRNLAPADVHTITDASGNEMYSLTLVAGEPDL